MAAATISTNPTWSTSIVLSASTTRSRTGVFEGSKKGNDGTDEF
jgi:hypothetical protein